MYLIKFTKLAKLVFLILILCKNMGFCQAMQCEILPEIQCKLNEILKQNSRYIDIFDMQIFTVFSPNGRFFAAASTNDNAIILWDFITGKCINRFAPIYPTILHRKRNNLLLGIAFSQDSRFLYAGYQNQFCAWDISMGNMEEPISYKPGYGWQSWNMDALAFSLDGNFLAAASFDGEIIIWNLVNKKIIRCFESKGIIQSLGFSSDSKFIAAGSIKTIFLWNIKKSTVDVIDSNPFDIIDKVKFSPDGQILAAAMPTGHNILFINVKNGGRQLLFGPQDEDANAKDKITAFSFSPDGTALGIVRNMSQVEIWHLNTKTCACTIPLLSVDFVTGITFSPDGATFIISWGQLATIVFSDLSRQMAKKECLALACAGHPRCGKDVNPQLIHNLDHILKACFEYEPWRGQIGQSILIN